MSLKVSNHGEVSNPISRKLHKISAMQKIAYSKDEEKYVIDSLKNYVKSNFSNEEKKQAYPLFCKEHFNSIGNNTESNISENHVYRELLKILKPYYDERGNLSDTTPLEKMVNYIPSSNKYNIPYQNVVFEYFKINDSGNYSASLYPTQDGANSYQTKKGKTAIPVVESNFSVNARNQDFIMLEIEKANSIRNVKLGMSDLFLNGDTNITNGEATCEGLFGMSGITVKNVSDWYITADLTTIFDEMYASYLDATKTLGVFQTPVIICNTALASIFSKIYNNKSGNLQSEFSNTEPLGINFNIMTALNNGIYLNNSNANITDKQMYIVDASSFAHVNSVMPVTFSDNEMLGGLIGGDTYYSIACGHTFAMTDYADRAKVLMIQLA